MTTVGNGFSLFIGGARSGKSALAVELALSYSGRVDFVATATAGDEDMAERIARHRVERPPEWATHELPTFGASDLEALETASTPADGLLIIDCLTMLVANLFFAEASADDIELHVDELSSALAARGAPSLLIANEVGMGVHPPTEMGRSYRDLLGRANKIASSHAETTLLIVAGKAVVVSEVGAEWT